MIVETATPGARGIDCVTKLDAAACARLKASGIDFVVRYLGALSVFERDAILGAGLALMAVGYSRAPGWVPTAGLGDHDGAQAVQNARSVGLLPGVSVWCDLEGCDGAPDVVAAYANAWFDQVSAGGFLPGVYVGFGVSLTCTQWYTMLKFKRYWRSCSIVPEPAERGFCMLQERPGNQMLAGIQVDKDTVQADAMGDLPVWLLAAPSEPEAPEAA